MAAARAGTTGNAAPLTKNSPGGGFSRAVAREATQGTKFSEGKMGKWPISCQTSTLRWALFKCIGAWELGGYSGFSLVHVLFFLILTRKLIGSAGFTFGPYHSQRLTTNACNTPDGFMQNYKYPKVGYSVPLKHSLPLLIQLSCNCCSWSRANSASSLWHCHQWGLFVSFAFAFPRSRPGATATVMVGALAGSHSII